MNELREYCAQAIMDNDGNEVALGVVVLVRAKDACPNCGERRMDELAWVGPDYETVRCSTCGHEYTPA